MIYLILGLLLGFYGRSIYDYVRGTYDMLREKFDTHQAGVVKPEVSRVTRRPVQEIDLTSESGGILRPSPDQVIVNRLKERNQNIKDARP